jgi:hydrogenase/urease accessory protein HupE
MTAWIRRLLFAWCAATALAPAAFGHPLSPTLLALTQRPGGSVFDVRWKTSVLRVPGSDLQPRLPEHCRVIEAMAAVEEADSLLRKWAVDCGERGLLGAAVGFSGLGPAKIDGLVRVELASGRVIRGVVRSTEPTLTVPADDRTGNVFFDYLRLGFDHIVGGLDHLLFVFGLLLLVDGTRTLIKTITSFTVGHSVTLSLAALGLVRYPTRPIELVIALSVFILAVELTRDPHGKPTLMRRWPWVIAMGFGLLHGLGFAGALAEVGLPQQDIPMALFSFNVGIEIGQLVFVFVVLAVQRALHSAVERVPRWAEMIPLYTMGSLAAFWCFQRLAAVLAT